MSAGCEVRPGNTSEDFFHAAVQGEEILSFQGSHWVPAPQAPRWVHRATKELNKDQGTRRTVRELLRDTCPPFVRGLLEAGRSELEKQGEPAPHPCLHPGAWALGPDSGVTGEWGGGLRLFTPPAEAHSAPLGSQELN